MPNIFDYFDDLAKKDPNFLELVSQEETALKICDFLRHKRQEKEICQAEFAKNANLNTTAVSRIETYTVSPKLSSLIKYVRGLGFDLAEVLEVGINELENKRQNES